MDQRKLDKFWLNQAEGYAVLSKDPRRKVGCIIVRENGTQASAGRNGFPRMIPDRTEWLVDRDQKRRLTIHAEMNALHFAHEDLHGATLYCTYFPCDKCSPHIIQRGIARVVAPPILDGDPYKDSQLSALDMFEMAGVVVEQFEDLEETV